MAASSSRRSAVRLAVVRSQISSPPSADSAAAAALNVAQNFFGLEALNRELPRMMAGPIAFALAETIDKQLANAVSANGCNGDRAIHPKSQKLVDRHHTAVRKHWNKVRLHGCSSKNLILQFFIDALGGDGGSRCRIFWLE